MKCLLLEVELFGETHPSLLDSYTTMSRIWFTVGEFEDAINYCKQAVAIAEASLGKEHEQTVSLTSTLKALQSKVSPVSPPN